MTELVKEEKKLKQKSYITNLLIVQNLWQAHFQISSIILVKKLINLNANMKMIIKNMKHIELNSKIASTAKEYTNVKDY